jgi:hypothetical protein
LVIDGIAAADLAELAAEDDRFDRAADAEAVGFHGRRHLVEERVVGELHRAAEGVSEQLAAELV